MAKKRATTGNDQLHLEVPDENDVGNDPHKKTQSRQHLLNEAESILIELPEIIRVNLPDTPDVRARLGALAERDRSKTWDPATALRLRLLDDHAAAVADLDAREKDATRELAKLTARAGSTLAELCGIAERSEAELLVEVGDPRRFAGEGGFARFNGTAPLPASPLRVTASRCGTASTAAATVGSTPCCTAWR